jgi:deoxyinosine 3'endonuclease (endonuclease V)
MTHVSVTASDPDVGVAEHLLHDREGDPFTERDRRRALPHVMHAVVRRPGRLQNLRPDCSQSSRGRSLISVRDRRRPSAADRQPQEM